MNMEVEKTILFFSDSDDGYVYLIDTIFWQGQWWLVARWLQSNDTGERVPERLVRLTGLSYQDEPGGPARFVLNGGIPKAVLDGEEREGYVVATYPLLAHSQPPSGNC